MTFHRRPNITWWKQSFFTGLRRGTSPGLSHKHEKMFMVHSLLSFFYQVKVLVGVWKRAVVVLVSSETRLLPLLSFPWYGIAGITLSYESHCYYVCSRRP